jgi:hypothetical protein
MPAKTSSVGIKVPKRRRWSTPPRSFAGRGKRLDLRPREELKGKGGKRCLSNSESSFHRDGGWILPR